MKLKKQFSIIISISLTIFAILRPAVCEAQSLTSRNNKPEKNKTESNSSRPKSKPTPSPTPKPKTQESSKPASGSTAPKTKPSSSHTPRGSYGAPIKINGYTVQWKEGATSAQRQVITDILRNMIYMPYDHYWMGCEDEYSFPDERPNHYVEVNAFSICDHEVTQREWGTIMGYNPSEYFGDDMPVTNVSYNDCVKFVNKLNELSRVSFKLPNETQWEYAARGGRYSNSYRYSGSNNASRVGWTSDNSDGRLHSVCMKDSNELGLYDMTGNVWEWTCSGWCDGYDNKRDYSSYVIRGGCYELAPRYARNTNRRHANPDVRAKSIGLRLVVQ